MGYGCCSVEMSDVKNSSPRLSSCRGESVGKSREEAMMNGLELGRKD